MRDSVIRRLLTNGTKGARRRRPCFGLQKLLPRLRRTRDQEHSFYYTTGHETFIFSLFRALGDFRSLGMHNGPWNEWANLRLGVKLRARQAAVRSRAERRKVWIWKFLGRVQDVRPLYIGKARFLVTFLLASGAFACSSQTFSRRGPCRSVQCSAVPER